MGSFTFLYTCGHFLNGLLPQLTTVKKGNLYLMIYLSSAYFHTQMGFDNPGTESVAMKNFSGFVYFPVQVIAFFLWV